MTKYALFAILLLWTTEAAVNRNIAAKTMLEEEEDGNSTGSLFECRHNPATVWNDVMFLFDISEATGSKHLKDMVATFQTLAFTYTIAKKESNEKMVMRAGVITYSKEAKTIAKLGEWDAEDILLWNPDIKKGDSQTGLKGAIQLANAELSGSAHRKTSRPVIVVFATTFNEYGQESPLTVAQEFISNGGAIITYDYTANDGDDSMLRKIASVGFALNSKDQNVYERLLYSQSYVNCFCPNNYHPYTTGDKNVPTGGCYWPVSSPAMSRLAKRRCEHFNDGIIVKIDSINKQDYLQKLTSDIGSYFIGAQKNITENKWHWQDGTELTFSKWCTEPVDDDGNLCAFIRKGDDVCWSSVDCNKGLQYVCQSAPCDSTRYCQLD